MPDDMLEELRKLKRSDPMLEELKAIKSSREGMDWDALDREAQLATKAAFWEGVWESGKNTGATALDGINRVFNVIYRPIAYGKQGLMESGDEIQKEIEADRLKHAVETGEIKGYGDVEIGLKRLVGATPRAVGSGLKDVFNPDAWRQLGKDAWDLVVGNIEPISGRDILATKFGEPSGFLSKAYMFTSGLAFDIAIDPTSYVNIGALTKFGKTSKGLGKLAPTVLEQMSIGQRSLITLTNGTALISPQVSASIYDVVSRIGNKAQAVLQAGKIIPTKEVAEVMELKALYGALERSKNYFDMAALEGALKNLPPEQNKILREWMEGLRDVKLPKEMEEKANQIAQMAKKYESDLVKTGHIDKARLHNFRMKITKGLARFQIDAELPKILPEIIERPIPRIPRAVLERQVQDIAKTFDVTIRDAYDIVRKDWSERFIILTQTKNQKAKEQVLSELSSMLDIPPADLEKMYAKPKLVGKIDVAKIDRLAEQTAKTYNMTVPDARKLVIDQLESRVALEAKIPPKTAADKAAALFGMERKEAQSWIDAVIPDKPILDLPPNVQPMTTQETLKWLNDIKRQEIGRLIHLPVDPKHQKQIEEIASEVIRKSSPAGVARKAVKELKYERELYAGIEMVGKDGKKYVLKVGDITEINQAAQKVGLPPVFEEKVFDLMKYEMQRTNKIVSNASFLASAEKKGLSSGWVKPVSEVGIEKGWKRMELPEKLGLFRNMQVRNDIAPHLAKAIEIFQPQNHSKLLKLIRQTVSISKGIMLSSPKTVMRNLFGNAFNLWVMDIFNPADLPLALRFRKAARRFARTGDAALLNRIIIKNADGVQTTGKAMLEEALRSGVYGTQRAIQEVVSEGSQVVSKFQKWNPFLRGFSEVEEMSKTMGAITAFKKGGNLSDAFRTVQKTLFDYSKVPRWVDVSRKYGITPFLAWTYFEVPFLLKTMLAKPGKYATASKFLNTWDSQYEKLRIEAVADYVTTNYGIPWRYEKESGEVAFKLLGNWLPITELINFFTNPREAFLSKLGPQFQVPIELLTNKHLETSRDIHGDYEYLQPFSGLGFTVEIPWWGRHLLRNIPILTQIDALSRRGKEGHIGEVLSEWATGLNTARFKPKEEMMKRALRKKGDKTRIKGQITYILRHWDKNPRPAELRRLQEELAK